MLMYCDLWPKEFKIDGRPFYCSQLYSIYNQHLGKKCHLHLWMYLDFNFSQIVPGGQAMLFNTDILLKPLSENLDCVPLDLLWAHFELSLL